MSRIPLIVVIVMILCTTAGGAEKAGTPRQVYVVPFSHLDFFWGGTREECLARGNRIIAKAIRLANQHSDFKFLIEDNDFLANYVESHTDAPELSDLKRLVKEGRIEIAPKWAAIFQDLQDGEILARNLVYGKRYARSAFGVNPQTVHLGDLPGYTPQYPQIMRKADTPYAVMSRMGPEDKALFFWKSPDGSKALTWFSLKGYGWGSHLGLHGDLTDANRQAIAKEVGEVEQTTTGPIFMNWGSDLWAANSKLIANIEALNSASPRFHFATPDDYFRRATEMTGVPELSGEIPSSWPNIVSSLPHMWPLLIPATNTLLAAEKFAAINYALHYSVYPQREFDFLWKKLIESTDHNHDGQGGLPGDERKRSYSEMSILRGGEILRDSLRNIAERVQIPIHPSFPIVVFNPLGWTRDDVVRTHLTLYGDVVPSALQDYRTGIRLVDETGVEIPFHLEQYSENISRALEIEFVARGVPSLGYKTYYLRPATSSAPSAQTAQVTLDSLNDTREPRRPLGSDVMENDFYRLSVDKATGRVSIFDKALNRDVMKGMEVVANEERGGNYIGIEPLSGRSIYTSVNRVEIEQNNAIRSVVKITGQIIDIPVTQRLTLYKALKRVEVENTVDWKTPRYVRIEQLFPYTAANAKTQYGVPYGSNDSGNVLPNSGPHLRDEITKESWLESRHINDWIFAGNADGGVTISTDHQFVRLNEGVIRGEMLRGTRHTSVKVVRGDNVDSMQYPPLGSYTFRYSITSGRGDWRANKSFRTGMDFNSPLMGISVVDDISRKTLPPTRSFLSLDVDNVVLSAVKKADLDGDIVVRLYENMGRAVTTPLSFLGINRDFRDVNLLEEPSRQNTQRALSVEPYEIKTVKLRIE